MDVLAYAGSRGRAVLTHNRKDFIKLHKQTQQHAGIVVCTVDRDVLALAQRIDQALLLEGSLENKLIRVTKPANR